MDPKPKARLSALARACVAIGVLPSFLFLLIIVQLIGNYLLRFNGKQSGIFGPAYILFLGGIECFVGCVATVIVLPVGVAAIVSVNKSKGELRGRSLAVAGILMTIVPLAALYVFLLSTGAIN
jgi:hypothetical protein